jgi:hypothetical protein
VNPLPSFAQHISHTESANMGLDKFLEKYTRVVLSIAGICSVTCFLVWVIVEGYHSIHHLIAGSP